MTRVAQDFLFLVLMNVLLVGICSAAARFLSDGVIIFLRQYDFKSLMTCFIGFSSANFCFNPFRMGKYNPVSSCYCFERLMTNEMRFFFHNSNIKFFVQQCCFFSWHRRMILGNNLSLSRDGWIDLFDRTSFRTFTFFSWDRLSVNQPSTSNLKVMNLGDS